MTPENQLDLGRDFEAVKGAVDKALAQARLHLDRHDSIVALLQLAARLAGDRVKAPLRLVRGRDGRELHQ